MDWVSEYIGAMLLFIGAVLGLKRRKRKFDRTNEFGVERFESYGGKLRARLKDGLLGGSSITLIAAGILILALKYQDSWGWIVILPVCAVMLIALIGV